MTTYGISSDGFTTKPSSAILGDLAANVAQRLQAAIDAGEIVGPAAVDTSGASVTGAFLGVLSAALGEVWQNAEGVYSSYWLNSADGVPLDNAGMLVAGITRNPATAASVHAAVRGVDGRSLTQSAKAALTAGGEYFTLQYPVTFDEESGLVRCEYSVETNVTDDAEITLNGTLFTATENAGADAAAALVAAINLADIGVTATDMTGGAFRVESDDYESTFTSVVGDRVTNDEFWNYALFEADEVGALDVPSGSLTTIATPFLGWSEVNNFIAGTSGTDRESAAAFRLRASQGVTGNATDAAILAAVLDVPGVTAARVYENDTMSVDGDGRPPKSFEVVVGGGDDVAIAQALYNVKADGIATYGSTSETITNVSGLPVVISFSRPTAIPIYISVVVTVSTEEDFPTDGEDAIADDLVAYFAGNNFPPGHDVLYQELYGVIYQTPGISSVALLIGTSGPPAGTTNISIGADEYATLSLGNVSVSIAP